MADKTFNPKVVKAWKKEVRAAKEEVGGISDQVSILENATKDLSESQIKQNKNLTKTLDLTKEAAKNGLISLKTLKDRASLIGDISKGEMDLNDIKLKEKSIEEEIITIKRRSFGANADKGKQLIKELELNKNLLGTEKERLNAEQQSNFLTSISDDLTGGLLSKFNDIKDAVGKLPPGMQAFAAVAIVASLILKAFSENLDAIGEEFGAIGVKDFASDLMTADAEMAKLGYDAGSAATVSKELSDNFGVGMSDAMGMSAAVGDMSKALGLSLEEGSQLVGMFTSIGGMSPQQAEDTAKMAAQLAQANNVNPASILKEIAGSTEIFAKFGKDGGTNLIEASIVAKKLGTNLDSVAGTMESMLDFSTSTSKAMEASVMIGRNLNIQKLQEASLAGDATAVLEEQKRLLGDSEKFNSMNVLQRKALAEALGLSVEEANKMVNAEREAAELSGDLSKQKGFSELVGKEALSSMTQMLNSVMAIGAALTKIFGPALNAIITPLSMIVGVIGSFVSLIDRTIGIMPIMIGLLTAYAVANRKAGMAAAWSTGKALVNTITNIWKAMSSMSAVTMGFGTPVALAMGAGAVATIIASVMSAKSKKVGDASIPAEGKGPVVSSPKIGGMFQGAPQDDILMGPGLAAATAGGSAGAGNAAVVQAINNLTNTTKENKPPSAKDVGNRTGRTLQQLGDG